MNRKHHRATLPQKPLHAMCLRLFFAFAMLGATLSHAQTNGYFVEFTDKRGSLHTLENPSAYLSERALVRRLRQHIAIDSTDLPVSATYVDSLKKLDLYLVHQSKWLNGAIVKSANTTLMDTLERISFVKSVQLSYGPFAQPIVDKIEETSVSTSKLGIQSDYGVAWPHIATLNGHLLHQKGFTGHGMHIAVIDAGFYMANELPLLDRVFAQNQVLGSRDFVEPGANVYQSDAHGTYVLSVMAGHSFGNYVGTAPDASYWLLRTEDVLSEYPIEADNWAIAAEFADSVGVDVINSSLGYGYYDNPSLSLAYPGIDGSSRVSRVANLAVKKGMAVINSAGNEGNKAWRYILTPADAPLVIAVGAMAADSARVAFSSVGPTADNRTKPDLMAMGYMNALQGTDGQIRYGSGTSFASPIIAGLTACLWQSAPWLKSEELVTVLRQSSHVQSQPNNLTGYGIPNFAAAMDLTGVSGQAPRYSVSGNPFSRSILVERLLPLQADGDEWNVQLLDLHGRLLAAESSGSHYIYLTNLGHLANGIYLLRASQRNHTATFKLIKQ